MTKVIWNIVKEKTMFLFLSFKLKVVTSRLKTNADVFDEKQ